MKKKLKKEDINIKSFDIIGRNKKISQDNRYRHHIKAPSGCFFTKKLKNRFNQEWESYIAYNFDTSDDEVPWDDKVRTKSICYKNSIDENINIDKQKNNCKNDSDCKGIHYNVSKNKVCLLKDYVSFYDDTAKELECKSKNKGQKLDGTNLGNYKNCIEYNSELEKECRNTKKKEVK